MAEALQPLQRALRSQTQGNSSRRAASTPPPSRPAIPQLNPLPRGAWRIQQSRTGQGFRGGNANQSGNARGGFFQPQGEQQQSSADTTELFARSTTVPATSCHPVDATSTPRSRMLRLRTTWLSFCSSPRRQHSTTR